MRLKNDETDVSQPDSLAKSLAQNCAPEFARLMRHPKIHPLLHKDQFL